MGVKVLGVCGSTRERSYSTRAAAFALEAARGRGAETQLLSLRELHLPAYDPDETDAGHEGVREATAAVEWADALLLATPDYHGSMSGVLKNFLDFYWEEFAGKLFGYVCASHEKGLTAMGQMRTAVSQCYGWSLPYGVSLYGEKDFDASGRITNVRVSGRLRMLARDLVVYGSLIRAQFQSDLTDAAAETFAARYRV
jgi:FMN reductase